MEPSCKFGLAYLPLGEITDPVAKQHVMNCTDCQQEVTLV